MRSLKSITLGMMCCLTVGHTATPVLGQALPAKMYLNDNVIVLPIHIDPPAQSQIKHLLLYVKKLPQENWTFQGSVAPDQQEFIYRAPEDGEYWFTMVTVDQSNQLNVSDLRKQPPQAIVVLERQPPQIKLQRLFVSAQGTHVRCRVDDQHPDIGVALFEYQTREKVWRPLDIAAGTSDTYCIPSEAPISGMIRVTARDRCGNKAQRVVHLQDCPTAYNHSIPVNPHVAGTLPLLPPVPPKQSNNSVLHDHVTKAVPLVQSSPQPLTAKKFINKSRLQLNYQIDAVGQSGVGKVEVWLTKDHGQHWQRLAEDSDKKTPVQVVLPGDGLYGLALVASNGLGFGGEPPAAGTSPDWWVEVDSQAPKAKILSIDPIKSNVPGLFLITWHVQDKNLSQQPIDLYFATKPSGPWHEIAKEVKNNGHYRWQISKAAGSKVYVRLAVTDQAGNSTISQTQDAVQVDDLSRPKVRINSITTVQTPSPRTPSLTITPASSGSNTMPVQGLPADLSDAGNAQTAGPPLMP